MAKTPSYMIDQEKVNIIKNSILAGGKVCSRKIHVVPSIPTEATGDMFKATYDVNNNGVVDNAEYVNGFSVFTSVPGGAVFTDTVYDETRLNNHIDNEDNPHNTTYDNIGGNQPEPIAHSHIEDDITNLDKYTKNEVDAKVGVVQIDIDNHIADVANPHAVTKAQVGLPNVDNTSDLNKPVSNPQQTEINTKENKLGNPTVDGYVLSSLENGTRSWIKMSGGVAGDDAYLLDGSKPIEADFQSGGYKLVDASPGIDDNDAVVCSQITIGSFNHGR